jgi:hypothetical protein
MLILHILIALTSLVVSTIALFRPSQTKLNVSYGLIAATLASGTVLVVQTHSPILQACMSGLTYTAFVAVESVFAQRRLAKARVLTRQD